MIKKLLCPTLFISILIGGCQGPKNQDTAAGQIPVEIVKELPFKQMTLTDLSEFQNTGNNWSIVGESTSQYLEEHDLKTKPGAGVLVNQSQPAENQNIRTSWEHGDLELKLDVMMPKGSNSGIYLQGRYEIQLFDSWNVTEPTFTDMGGIYQCWDESRSTGQQGYEGRAPHLNASLAPGLWQRIHLLFRAPRFDAQGNKLANAHFEYVYLNDRLIHQNAEVSGPTRAHQEEGETATAPLYFQGDHGPVAFRNIQYKTYGLDTLSLTDLTYKFYSGKFDYIPDFDSMTPLKNGTVDYFNLDAVTDQQEGFCTVFEGNLHVPIEGTYLFETFIDDGGDLWIDSALVVHNEGEPGWGEAHATIDLAVGDHSLRLTYYQEVWSSKLLVYYEGPQISRRPLASIRKKESWEIAMESQPAIVLDHLDNPQLLRSFMMLGSEKLTHAISVGDPSGVHYSYDLNSGSLVKCWKGPFGDVTDMWQGRGESQLMQPLTPTVNMPKFFPVTTLASPSSSWPKTLQSAKYLGYSINENQYPVFRYQQEDRQIEDQMVPDNGALKRTIQLLNGNDQNLYIKLGEAPKIIALSETLYSLDGQFYLSTNESGLIIRSGDGGDELIAAMTGSSFSYNILW
jgi:hypothetical protein